MLGNNSGFLVSLTPLIAGARGPLAGPSTTDCKMRHVSGRCHHTTNVWWSFWCFTLCHESKLQNSHLEGSGSGLLAAPLGKGVIAANESKGRSDRNRSPVPWPQWLLGYFHVTALDNFSKAGCSHVAGRGKSLFLVYPELQPASLKSPLFVCLAFSYLPAITSVTTSQVAVRDAV